MPPVQYHNGAFPPNALDWSQLIPLIGPAHAAIAGYASALHAVPNANILLSPMTTQEAVLSSKIEGTQAAMGEVLQFEASNEAESDEKRGDIQEVLNYRATLRYAEEAINELPLSPRLIRNAHEVLLEGVRGEDKTPGEFRRVQNWIGSRGCAIQEARFVPPSAGQIPDLMSNWEKYLHSMQDDVLVQLAVLHAEFEAIHPFLDGNGRLGRVLVPLFLVDKKLLDSPNFYISAYLEANQEEYYDRLLAVSRDGDWSGWCAFFLTAVIEEARRSEKKAKKILDLYHAKKDWVAEATHSQYAVRALDWFFERPIFKNADFISITNIPDPTARRIVRLVRDGGLLREAISASGRRSAILVFPELLNIVEGREVF